MGHPVLVLRHSLRRSVQSYEVEHGRDAEYELLEHGKRPRDVSIHDDWVSVTFRLYRHRTDGRVARVGTSTCMTSKSMTESVCSP